MTEPTFGDLLKQLRRQAYMTQRDLALATGYSVGQICRFEQNQRIPDLPTLAARFVPALAHHTDAATTERLLALAHAARAAHHIGQRRRYPAPPSSGREMHHHLQLPPLLIPSTPLLGRAHEVAHACDLFRDTAVRLLTLTGAPGIGKTRLGLEVAAELQATFTDGVLFVPLAPLSDPNLVAGTIARALDVAEERDQSDIAALTAALRAKRMLLLLDNFEHVLAAAPLIADLLASAPGLTVLVTSRAPLRIRGEHEVAVPPLALPSLGPLLPPDQLIQSPAVELFIARAQAVKTPLPLAPETIAAIARICIHLDGLPLAIELAAAWVKIFAPQALLPRLERRLQLLTTGARDLPVRQQTLRSTIDWSYRLLSGGGQRLFARLGVFVGGCTLEAAEAVCAAADVQRPDVLNGLAALVEQGLLRHGQGPDGEPRFAMLETIREYALERLVASELEALRQQHADYHLALAEAAAPSVSDAQQGAWLDRLEAEHDNLRATLRWALDRGDGAIAGRLSAALAHFWYAHSHLSEGRTWLEQALALLDRAAPMADVRARVLNGAGMLAYTQGDYGPAFAYLQASIALARDLGDQSGTALGLDAMGWTALVQGDPTRAQPFLEEGLALFQGLGQTRNIAVSLTSLGTMALLQGDFSRATTLCKKSLTLARAVGAKAAIGLCLATLGSTALVQGHSTQAQAHFEECLPLSQNIGNRLLTAVCLIGLAGAAVAQHQATRAARLLGVSEVLLQAIGSSIPPAARPHYELIVASTQFQLGEPAFTAMWTAGRALPLEQAIAYALGDNDRAPQSSPT